MIPSPSRDWPRIAAGRRVGKAPMQQALQLRCTCLHFSPPVSHSFPSCRPSSVSFSHSCPLQTEAYLMPPLKPFGGFLSRVISPLIPSNISPSTHFVQALTLLDTPTPPRHHLGTTYTLPPKGVKSRKEKRCPSASSRDFLGRLGLLDLFTKERCPLVSSHNTTPPLLQSSVDSRILDSLSFFFVPLP